MAQIHRQSGKERDSESGNDYAMMRYNVNRLARFSSPDPLAGSTADPQSLNRYPYVKNDPIDFIDPWGLECSWNSDLGIIQCEVWELAPGNPGYTPPSVGGGSQPGGRGSGSKGRGGGGNSSWLGTFTKTFVSNFFSPTFYRQEFKQGACLRSFMAD